MVWFHRCSLWNHVTLGLNVVTKPAYYYCPLYYVIPVSWSCLTFEMSSWLLVLWTRNEYCSTLTLQMLPSSAAWVSDGIVDIWWKYSIPYLTLKTMSMTKSQYEIWYSYSVYCTRLNCATYRLVARPALPLLRNPLAILSAVILIWTIVLWSQEELYLFNGRLNRVHFPYKGP